MHSKTLIPTLIPITTINGHDHDQDHDLNSDYISPNSLSKTNNSHDDYKDNDRDKDGQIHDEFDHEEIVLDTDTEPESSGATKNNPPDSFWISTNKVSDWLNHHTFIERKSSVKLVTVSRKFDPTQPRSSQRSVSFNHKPQRTIIGFRRKPGHSNDGKGKENDRPDSFRLFKNWSLPSKSSGLQVMTEPKSPRVSCIGRVGSIRGRARKTGFWKSFTAAILNQVRMNKASKQSL